MKREEYQTLRKGRVMAEVQQRIVKCDKGHWYDTKKHGECPHCKSGGFGVTKEPGPPASSPSLAPVAPPKVDYSEVLWTWHDKAFDFKGLLDKDHLDEPFSGSVIVDGISLSTACNVRVSASVILTEKTFLDESQIAQLIEGLQRSQFKIVRVLRSSGFMVDGAPIYNIKLWSRKSYVSDEVFEIDIDHNHTLDAIFIGRCTPEGNSGCYVKQIAGPSIEGFVDSFIKSNKPMLEQPIDAFLISLNGPEAKRVYPLYHGDGRDGNHPMRAWTVFIDENPRVELKLLSRDEKVSDSSIQIWYVNYQNKNCFIIACYREWIYKKMYPLLVNGHVVTDFKELKAHDIIEFKGFKLVFLPLSGERFSWDDWAADEKV